MGLSIMPAPASWLHLDLRYQVMDMLPRLVKLKGTMVDFLFPQWCVGCGKEGALLCASCLSLLPRLMPPLCPRCGLPQSNGVLCPTCADWEAEIEGIRSPFQFDGAIRQAVHQLKYQNVRALARPLAKLMYDYLQANPLPADTLVPVPLHRKRLRERGFNQSGLLTRELGELSGIAVVDDCLIRQRHTSPQARTSSADERRRNVADAFACVDGELAGKQVLLIDDVSTSGATLDACASKLKAAGAKSVWGLVLAREI